MAAASLVQGCVGAVDVVSTLAVMTFLFFTANKSVTLHLYSYCLHSEQSGMEHYYFLHLPSSVYGFLEKQISYFPLFLLFPSLFLHLLLWFLYMTLLFHCVCPDILELAVWQPVLGNILFLLISSVKEIHFQSNFF